MESGVATHYTKHVYMPPASKQERGGACENMYYYAVLRI